MNSFQLLLSRYPLRIVKAGLCLLLALLISALPLQSAYAYRLLKRIHFNAGVPVDFLAVDPNPGEIDNTIIHSPITQSFPDTELIILAAFRTTDVPKSTNLFYRWVNSDDRTFHSTEFANFSRVDISQVPISGALAASLKAAGQTFVYVATAKISIDAVKLPGVEYYFRIDDGTTVHFYKSAQSPQFVDVRNEFCYEERVFAGGGVPGNPQGALAAGLSSLTVFPGAATNDFNLNVCLKHPALLSGSLRPVNNPAIVNSQAFAWVTVGPDRMKLGKAAKLVTAYNDFDGNGIVDGTSIQATELRLFWWDGFEWRYVGGNVDVQNRKVTTNISQFSTYALFAAAPNVSKIIPKEKIITPATADGINDVAHFDGLADENVTIKIFDITGRLIRTLNNLSVWDGKSDSGNIVENGVYIYQVYLNDATYSGVIAVAK